MHSASDEKKLKECLSGIINAIDQCIHKLKNSKRASTATTTEHSSVDNSDEDYLSINNNMLTLDNGEIDLLDELTEEIESLLNECFPYLTSICADSFDDYLYEYQYDREKQKFVSPLTKNVLPSMRQELKGFLASSQAFSAASTGQQAVVRKFIDEYPTLKNKSSLWGVTLLYTAAFNNQLKIVEYLIERAHCAVDAKNWVNMHIDPSSTGGNTLNPKPGSTALHGACFSDHLPIVEYLIREKHADYFIKNQANKTSVDYSEKHTDIKQFFQDFLLLSYSASSSTDLPKKPITEENRPQEDCIWEYKPLQESEWHKFADDEARTLQRAMMSPENDQAQVQLKTSESPLNISLKNFLRSDDTESAAPSKQAWIRCRGSSLLNFDVQAIWQLMFIHYPGATLKNTSLLKVSHLTTTFNSDFDVELNRWYTCDTRTNLLLNDSMNVRRKNVVANIHLGMSDEPFNFNLHTFTFTNDEKTADGYLRWIPEIFSHEEQRKNNRSETMDDARSVASTTERRIDETMHSDEQFDDEDININDDDDDESTTITKKGYSNTKETLTPGDKINKDSLDTSTSLGTNTDALPKPVQPSKLSRPEHDRPPSRPEHDQPSSRSDQDKPSSRSELSHGEKVKMKKHIDRIDELEKELSKHKENEKSLKELEKQITTRTDYVTKPSKAMQIYLFGKEELVIKHLNEQQRLPDYYVNKIPKVFFREQNSNYSASLTGLPTHHHEFEVMLQRISHLSHETEQAKHEYKEQISHITESVIKVMMERIKPSEPWKYYTTYFLRILKEKQREHLEHFDDYIISKSKLCTDRALSGSHYEPRKELKESVKHYKNLKPFTEELEKIKHDAVTEFVKEQILLPQQRFDKKPSKESIEVLNTFIREKKVAMNEDQNYRGLDVKHFKLISKLLQSIALYYHCFEQQLPLFEAAPGLLEKIRRNTVVTISTSTGSGKSTLLPALLIAEGYDRVLVTQPRRLPCTSICERVNSTMTSNKDGERIAGWAVSGAESEANSAILYLTDGLLREQILHNENLITDQTKLDKSVVFFLDEVHERSINIDLCLALFTRLLTEKPHLKSKMKLVISSATLDSSVPTLFREINQFKFAEFTMPKLGTLFPVTKHERPNDNIIALVQELNKKRQYKEQILCFVNSVADVHLGCRLLQEVSSGSIVAYPLVQSQSATEQQMYIEQGSIFFSTTVAETSLTFPSLRYVIDTGMINIPVYDFKKQHTVLEKIRAAESTIKQRLGRLGRTQPGDYYALYNFRPEEKKYPTPQICQSELTNIELLLRKSLAPQGLKEMKKFLPNEPSQEAIDAAVNKLRRLGVITAPPNEHFTKVGNGIAKLPDFGSVEMSIAVYYALTRYICGRDLIVISSVLGVLNTSAVIKSLPSRLKSIDGDFMTLLNMMNEVLNAKQSMPTKQFNLKQFCQEKGLQGAYHTINQACRRYQTLGKAFSLSKDYRTQAQVQSGNWELIAKALLKGYSDHVFVSLKELHGRSHRFSRYQSSKSDIDVAILDRQSTLSRSITSAPVATLVIARDIRYSTSVRAMAVLSFVGELKASWIEYEVEREIHLNEKEEEKLTKDEILSDVKRKYQDQDVHFQLSPGLLTINGSSGLVLDAELFILQKLVETMKFSSPTDLPPDSEEYATMKRNLEGILKMTHIFNPMRWRWENQEQVKITVEQSPTADLKITVRGRNSKNLLVKEEFDALFVWLKKCLVIRTPNSGLPPRLLIPQVRRKYPNIEERISHVTDSKRTVIDLWNGLEGPEATRETRMEVVAWIAVCMFGCKLEGGFVRDWIVGHNAERPQGKYADPSRWVSFRSSKGKVSIPFIHNEMIPSDLDCHLPVYAYFDVDKFLDTMYRYHIECQVFREEWRYILLVDEHTRTGPFTVELIEPHVALTHDRIDFDVSNLSLEKNYTKELGMRVDTEQEPYLLKLETIVERICNKQFQVLRPIDELIQQRIDKMVKIRGWSMINPPLHVIPRPPGKHNVILAPLPPSFDLYKNIEKQMQAIPNVKVLKIEEIRNPKLEKIYLGMKETILSECKDRNVNERELFHGTQGEAIDGIRNSGYDDRHMGAGGDWGRGAYFADNPHHHPHGHTTPSGDGQTRVIYYNKVLLGNMHVMRELNRDLQSAPIGYHSVHGIHPDNPIGDEYIVYRFGQALPYLKITYTA